MHHSYIYVFLVLKIVLKLYYHKTDSLIFFFLKLKTCFHLRIWLDIIKSSGSDARNTEAKTEDYNKKHKILTVVKIGRIRYRFFFIIHIFQPAQTIKFYCLRGQEPYPESHRKVAVTCDLNLTS